MTQYPNLLDVMGIADYPQAYCTEVPENTHNRSQKFAVAIFQQGGIYLHYEDDGAGIQTLELSGEIAAGLWKARKDPIKELTAHFNSAAYLRAILEPLVIYKGLYLPLPLDEWRAELEGASFLCGKNCLRLVFIQEGDQPPYAALFDDTKQAGENINEIVPYLQRSKENENYESLCTEISVTSITRHHLNKISHQRTGLKPVGLKPIKIL
ncbi:MAG: hypothetical protein ACOYK8_06120 [Alphaproteobacteria bacterium]